MMTDTLEQLEAELADLKRRIKALKEEPWEVPIGTLVYYWDAEKRSNKAARLTFIKEHHSPRYLVDGYFWKHIEPVEGQWMDWDGQKEFPYPDRLVAVECKDSSKHFDDASVFCWSHDNTDGDIMRFCLMPREEEE